MVSTRHEAVGAQLVALVDALAAGLSVQAVMRLVATACVEATDVAAAAVLLTDGTGSLRVAGSSDRRAYGLAVAETSVMDGPGVEALRTGQLVRADLVGSRRWLPLCQRAVHDGYYSVVAIPKYARTVEIGALVLYRGRRDPLPDADVAICRAFAHIGAIAALQERDLDDALTTVQQLQGALDSRIVVEQAKGVLVARAHLSVDAAFELVRGYARRHNLRLHEVAADVVAGRLGPADLAR